MSNETSVGGTERDLTQRTTTKGKARVKVIAPAVLLRDDEASVERLAAALAEHGQAIGFEHVTVTCGPGCARAIIERLRE